MPRTPRSCYPAKPGTAPLHPPVVASQSDLEGTSTWFHDAHLPAVALRVGLASDSSAVLAGVNVSFAPKSIGWLRKRAMNDREKCPWDTMITSRSTMMSVAWSIAPSTRDIMSANDSPPGAPCVQMVQSGSCSGLDVHPRQALVVAVIPPGDRLGGLVHRQAGECGRPLASAAAGSR